jgi:hypothetical protein
MLLRSHAARNHVEEDRKSPDPGRMLKWLSKRKVEDVVGEDIATARALIPSLRLKLDKEGPATARAYGDGLAEVTRALAKALGRDVAPILAARDLDANTIIAALRDIAATQERCRQYLDSDSEAVRELARKLSFGCLVLTHLYRMRLHALSAPEERRGEAGAVADTYANLTRVLWQIANLKTNGSH